MTRKTGIIHHPPPAPERRLRHIVTIVALLLVAALTWAAWWFFHGRFRVVTNDAYVTGNIVPVEDQVPGTISKVLVENTEFVHAGQVMAILQGDQSRLQRLRAEAHLGAEVRRVRRAFAVVTRLRHIVASKNVELKQSQDDLRRFVASFPSGAISAIRVQDTQRKIQALQAQVAAEQAALAGAEAIVARTTLSANPLVRQAAAQVETADVRWQRRIIRAPISGFVAERAAYPGIRAHPGQHLFSVVPLNDVWVVANVKETDMKGVQPGQSVALTSYYYGHAVHYHGIVQGLLPGAGSAFSILPPENATGNYIHIVERVPVRITLSPKELAAHPLRPGLSMVAEIHLNAHPHSVLRPLTRTPIQGYQTTIYEHELARAKACAARIIRANS